jgi:hypothetical protein
MKAKFSKLVMLVIAFFTVTAYAQQQPIPTHTPWTKQDSAAINALVLYPDSVRMAIFEACEYPAVIVNIAQLQKNSSSEFSDLVSKYSKDEQEDIWNLSRYPGLISQLAQGGKKSPTEINAILINYPLDIHDIGLKYGTDYYDLLKKIDDLQTQTNTQFEQTIADYPADVQAAFRQLIQLPEALSLLNDDLSLTVRVGDHYKRDPQGVMRRTDSLGLVEARQNAQDVQQWKNTIATDTAAQNDLKSAGTEYAESNGYTQDQVDAPIDDTNTISNYSCEPYSYWFGYPTWYPYSYWYPYPYWYDLGYYYGPGGNLICFGLPSYYFTNWYFYYPDHLHRYPRLGSAYISHYYGGHRTVFTDNALVVHNWVHNNRAFLPSDFKTNPSSRVEAVREVGKMNSDLMGPMRTKTVSDEARVDYLQKNSAKYPALNSNPQQPKIEEGRQVPNVMHQPERQPAMPVQRGAAPQQARNNAPRQQFAPRGYNYNNVNHAQEYHQNVWRQAAQPAQRQESQPAYHAPAQESAPRMSAPSSSPRGR